MKIYQTCKNICYYLILQFIIISLGCRKFVEVPPPQTQLVSSSVFSNDVGALAAQSNIYFKMANSQDNLYLNLYPAISSDEMDNITSDPYYIQIATNSLTSDNSYIDYIWSAAYNDIYQANAVMAGVSASSSISNAAKQQVLGEAEFTRAYWNFYLVNLFGDIPLITSIDYKENALAVRTPVVQVYQKIILDLKDAQTKLSTSFVESDGITSKSTTERLRPTKSAASALLARVYLYTGDWANAEAQASNVINNTSMFTLLSDLNSVFLANSQEAIWQISQNNQFGANTAEGNFFNLSEIPPNSGLAPGGLSTQLLNAFEPNDMRKDNWIAAVDYSGITYYYPYKYKVFNSTSLTEYEMVLRLAEQYLIRAEARAQQDRISDAVADLNIIRKRAGLNPFVAIDKKSLLVAVLHERQVELFTEGHRWLDLKRTLNIDAVMTVATLLKGGSIWNSYQQLYPIPSSEIISDNNLRQNSGY